MKIIDGIKTELDEILNNHITIRNRKTPELDMVNDCYNFFQKSVGYKYVVTEVPFLSRCIDMVLINENGVILTIEFKIHNIKQAIKQARDHSLGADYAFICIPEKKNLDMDLFKKENIGLFVYNPSVENKVRTVFMPDTSKRKVSKFNEMMLKNTMKIKNNELFEGEYARFA